MPINTPRVGPCRALCQSRADIDDGNILDQYVIESLVYRQYAAAVLFGVPPCTSWGANQVGASASRCRGGCLTEWHVHTNLCFSKTPRVRGRRNGSAAGRARRARANHVSQPMIHVWLVPAPGRAVGRGRLQSTGGEGGDATPNAKPAELDPLTIGGTVPSLQWTLWSRGDPPGHRVRLMSAAPPVERSGRAVGNTSLVVRGRAAPSWTTSRGRSVRTTGGCSWARTGQGRRRCCRSSARRCGRPAARSSYSASASAALTCAGAPPPHRHGERLTGTGPPARSAGARRGADRPARRPRDLVARVRRPATGTGRAPCCRRRGSPVPSSPHDPSACCPKASASRCCWPGP